MDMDTTVVVESDKENVRPFRVRVPLKAIAHRGKNTYFYIDEDNFMYIKNREREDTIYLTCRNKRSGNPELNCKVSAMFRKSEPDYIYMMNKHEHNHVSNAARAEAYIIESKAIQNAIENPSIKPRTLYTDMIWKKDLLPNIKHALPCQSNFTKKLKVERKAAGITAEVKEPKTFLQLVEQMPEGLKTTADNDRFLVYSGYGDEENEALGFMVFASPFGLDLLKRAQTWFSDGTFTLPKGIFEQLYVIHGLSPDDIAYPAAYCLMADKSAMSYRAVFGQMKKLVPDGPEAVVVDQEQAPINMYTEFYPDTKIEACEFHWRKALRSQLGLKGVLTLYNHDVKIQNVVDMFKALAFVPVSDITKVFDEVLEPLIAKIVSDEAKPCPEQLESYFNYLEHTYVGKYGRNGRRSKPRFPVELWGKYEAVLAGRHRTSNSCENWHSAIQDQLDTRSVYKFLNWLQKEDNLMEMRMDKDQLRLKPDTPPGLLEGGSRKIYTREKAAQLLDIVQRWGTMRNVKYLTQISGVIKRR